MIPTIVNCHLLTVCVRADLVKQAKNKKWTRPAKGEKKMHLSAFQYYGWIFCGSKVDNM